MNFHDWSMVDAVAAEPICQRPTARMFLAARDDARRATPRCTGISSDALARYGAGGREPVVADYPADLWDLAACERTWRMAPDDLRVRMLPVLDRYRAHVAERYPRPAPATPTEPRS